MLNINKIQEDIFSLLESIRREQPSLLFTFRRSNRSNRLEEGYWFYGNEGYLAVSFWSGMDWKNKTPNIIFVVSAGSGDTYLEINTSDSDQKRDFISKYISEPLRLEASGIRFRKYYSKFGPDYLKSLTEFLRSDKVKIDEIINDRIEYLQENKIDIGFLNFNDFSNQRTKIIQYRARRNRKGFDERYLGRPSKLKRIIIERYGPIDSVELEEIPRSAQWVFITGENGTGKTSILRAIATAISGRMISTSEIVELIPPRIGLTLYSGENILDFTRIGNETNLITLPLTSGFCAYGQTRLTTASGDDEQLSSLTSSLFEEYPRLIDLQSQLEKWRTHPDLSAVFNKRKEYITEILIDVIPNLYDIQFSNSLDGKPETLYIEKDGNGQGLRTVAFYHLASGLKSMVAMLGDIMIRLYEQQPNIFDPSEFTGVVIIDEIDVHLHPKLQRLFVQQLSATFPEIQFIVSTHSPIPLLGAPKNSVIYTVTRNANTGVKASRLDERILIQDLLPNTILTSPIFGLEDIVPISHESKKVVRTESTFEELQLSNQIHSRIKDFITDSKETELIELFKRRIG